ncbi:MAG: cofactor-independent phosphoglycerate mutase [Armatimonadetes bacterium]|nr:cofactor-independent phosphoglycerate mutase [Armatimonadota bacterium]
MPNPSVAHRPKRVIVIMDGAADEPQAELGGRTPLQAARMPNSDLIAREGIVGLAQTIPEGMEPGSDIATLSILGYDPKRYHTGRAPLEAASLDVPLNAADVAFRCNLVTCDGVRLLDYSAGEVSTAEARTLVGLLNEKLATRRLQFYAGISYRHIMVWRAGSPDVRTTPPHDIIGELIESHLPDGDGEDVLRALMFDSLEILDSHDINRRRRDEGKNPANMIWLWGQGRKCELPAFALERGAPGVVIAAVDLVRGVGKSAGLAAPEVPGATGNLETDFRAKAEATLAALEHYDFALVHIEAPDEASHQGSPERKVWALERIDTEVIEPLLKRLQALSESRIMIVSDHYTKISTRTHAREPVPFAMLGVARDRAETFDEQAAASTGRFLEEGWRLPELLFEG